MKLTIWLHLCIFLLLITVFFQLLYREFGTVCLMTWFLHKNSAIILAAAQLLKHFFHQCILLSYCICCVFLMLWHFIGPLTVLLQFRYRILKLLSVTVQLLFDVLCFNCCIVRWNMISSFQSRTKSIWWVLTVWSRVPCPGVWLGIHRSPKRHSFSQSMIRYATYHCVCSLQVQLTLH